MVFKSIEETPIFENVTEILKDYPKIGQVSIIPSIYMKDSDAALWVSMKTFDAIMKSMEPKNES